MSRGVTEDEPGGYWPFGWDASGAPASTPEAGSTRRGRPQHAGAAVLVRWRLARRPASGRWWSRTTARAAVHVQDLGLLVLAAVVTVLVVLTLL